MGIVEGYDNLVIDEGENKMRYTFAIWVIIVLVFLFFFSLFGLAESGTSGLILAGLSGFGLYKIFKIMYEGYKSEYEKAKRPSGCRGSEDLSDPLEFIVFYDLTCDVDPSDWDDY